MQRGGFRGGRGFSLDFTVRFSIKVSEMDGFLYYEATPGSLTYRYRRRETNPASCIIQVL
jgi:hypothetical protein